MKKDTIKQAHQIDANLNDLKPAPAHPFFYDKTYLDSAVGSGERDRPNADAAVGGDEAGGDVASLCSLDS